MDVSILIATYNRCELLKRSMFSALGQGPSAGYEVVVVDDGSRDGTAEFLSAQTDARVKWVQHVRNRGTASAWLSGIEAAAGEHLVFLCDDDELPHGFVERRLAALGSEHDCAFVFTGYRVQDERGNVQALVTSDFGGRRVLTGDSLLEAALAGRTFLHTGLYRRKVLDDLPARVREAGNAIDYAINVELALQHTTALYLPVQDFVYLDHPGAERHASSWPTVFGKRADFLAAVSREITLSAAQRRLVARERSNWNVMWSRRLREEGARRASQRRLMHAISADWRNRWAWTQLVRSVAQEE